MLLWFVIIYWIISVAIGIYAAKWVHNTRDFAVAGRRMPMYIVTATVFATWFGSETVLGIPATFMKEGFAGTIADPFGSSLCLVLVGLFFARVIKAAVPRQREFLADASSVQFTRNPDGICGALDQIHAAAAGAAISSRYAEDISHMFFGQAIRVYFGGLFDTHPPLEDRIAALEKIGGFTLPPDTVSS